MSLTGSASNTHELQGSVESGGEVRGNLTGLPDTIRGYSAFEVAVINGFSGTEVEWLASLRGKKGDKGDTGEAGYTPVKGKDYFDGEKGEKGDDGYTPVKGVDYVDGKDGYTPVKGVDYVDGKDGYTPVKGVDYTDGKDGKDGVSCTHEWDGTKLTINSASGTSTADLKGEKGDKGDPGQNGLDGVGDPSNWSQNDKTSGSYVFNRTHWKEVAEDQKLVSLNSLEFAADSQYANKAGLKFTLVADETYIVQWGDTEYEVDAITDDGGDVYLGNQALHNSDNPSNEYPFYIASFETGTVFFSDTPGITIECHVYPKSAVVYHKLDKNYIPDNALNSDWAQNDETQGGYIQNRTHWKEIVKGETVLSTKNISFTAGSNSKMVTSLKVALTEGEKYIVSWNGVEYEVVAMTAEGSSSPYLGNASLKNSENPVSEYPFCIQGTSLITYFYRDNTGEAETIPVSITKGEIIYHKLDKNYLPDDIGGSVETVGSAEAVAMLAECGILVPAYQDGTFYTDGSSAVYIL